MSQKTTRGTHVLVLCMLNQPAVHVESACIHVSIECPNNAMGTCVLLMLYAEMTHAQSNTHVRTAQALGNMCAPCAEFRDIRLTRDCVWFQHVLFWSAQRRAINLIEH